MGDINLSPKDIKHLSEGVKRKFNNTGATLNPNSNPENYIKLRDQVFGKHNSNARIRFLRSFFYDSIKSGKRTFRKKNIDLLSKYAFGMDFQSFLKERESLPEVRHSFYCEKRDIEKVSILSKELEVHTPEIIPIESSLLSTIIDKTNEEGSKVHFYVSEHLLKNEKGATHLINILKDNLFKYLFDLNILFHFDPDLKLNGDGNGYNLVTQAGKLKFIKYWHDEKLKKQEIFGEDLGFEFPRLLGYDKLIGVPFFLMLKALAEIMGKDWGNKMEVHANKSTVNYLHPSIHEMMDGLTPEPINNIWKNTCNDNEIQTCNFLCVIGYEGFLKYKEQFEMIKYFKNFNEKIIEKGHGVIRIFTIPVEIFDESRKSAFNIEANKLLYQYIYINAKTNAKTYLFTYSAKEKPSSYILQYQDYVIRVKKYLECRGDIAEDIHHKYFTIDDIDEQDELYLAYPEDMYGINRILKINHKNSVIRYFEDFRHRIRYIYEEQSQFKNERIHLDEIDSILIPILNLKKEEIQEIRVDVDNIFQKEKTISNAKSNGSISPSLGVK